jgi:hypothetical protein
MEAVRSRLDGGRRARVGEGRRRAGSMGGRSENFRMKARSMRSFQRQAQAPSAVQEPRETTARPWPVPMSPRNRACGRQWRPGSPASWRSRLSKSGRAARTAKTPDLGRAASCTVAQSPAAKRAGWLTERRVLVHDDETGLIDCESAGPNPGGGAGLGGPEDGLGREVAAVLEDDAVWMDGGDRLAGDDGHSGVVQGGEQPSAHAGGMGGKDGCSLVNKGEIEGGAEARLHGEGDLDAPRPGADDDGGDGRAALRGAGAQNFPRREKRWHGFGGNGVFGGARNAVGGGGASDVERGEVEGQRRSALKQDAPGLEVEADGAGADEPDAGPAAEPAQVDVGFLPVVEAGQVARDHA